VPRGRAAEAEAEAAEAGRVETEAAEGFILNLGGMRML